MTKHVPIKALDAECLKPSGLLAEQAAGDALAAQGFARFHLRDTAFAEYLRADFAAFAAGIPKSLRPDPYDSSGLRRRRYTCFVFLPDQDRIMPMGRAYDELELPKARYFQPAAYQPDEGDHVRTFDALLETQIGSRALLEMVKMDFRIAVQSRRLPSCPSYLVGVHFICLEPLKRQLAAVSPNTIHRDGELLTFAHLLAKRNVHGGWNAVTRVDSVDRHPSDLPESEIFAQFALEDAGESYVVDDRQVAHFVEGVGLEDVEQWGHRTVALVDFSPIRRVRSNDLDRMTPPELVDLGQ